MENLEDGDYLLFITPNTVLRVHKRKGDNMVKWKGSKELDLYMCEKCHAVYGTLKAAEECEEWHEGR